MFLDISKGVTEQQKKEYLKDQFSRGCNKIDCNNRNCANRSKNLRFNNIYVEIFFDIRCSNVLRDVDAFIEKSRKSSTIIRQLLSGIRISIADRSFIKSMLGSLDQLAFSFLDETFDPRHKTLFKDDFHIDYELLSSFAPLVYMFEDDNTNFMNILPRLLRTRYSEWAYVHIRAIIIMFHFEYYFIKERRRPDDFLLIFFSSFSKNDHKHNAYSIMEKVLSEYPSVMNAFLTVIHSCLNKYLCTIDINNLCIDENIITFSNCMQKLKRVNESSVKPLPDDSFSNDLLSELLVEYTNATYIIDYHFLRTKSHLLNRNTKYDLFYIVVDQRQKLFREKFTISFNRQNTIREVQSYLYRSTAEQFSSKLTVSMPNEEAIDAGGPGRELFNLVVKMFSPDYGMFEIKNGYCWMRKTSLDSDHLDYYLLGILMALAIYNKITLPIRFPPVFFKMLFDQKPTINDLAEIEPELASGFRDIMEMLKNGEDIKDLSLQFTATYKNEISGYLVYELVEGGKDIIVDNLNAEDYIQMYMDWIFKPTLHFLEFKKGFEVIKEDKRREKVYPYCLNEVFSPRDISIIASGEDVYDWNSLKEDCRYLGYSKDDPVVKWFWKFIFNSSDDIKIKFLKFLTGSDRPPVGGLGQLHLIIQRISDAKKLPVAHTCYQILDIPPYETEEELNKKLSISIMNEEGFGLK